MVTKFTVMGSCASRDIFYSKINKDYKKFFQIKGDGTRLSFVSIMQDPINYNLASIQLPTTLENHFRYSEWIKNDFDKSFLKTLKQEKIDYILIDTYYDVNYGIVDLGGGKYVTNNQFLEKTDFFKGLDNPRGLTIQENFEEYYYLWIKHCDLFFDFLNVNCPNIKVILNPNRHVSNLLKNDGSIIKSPTFEEDCNRYNPYRDILDKYIIEHFDVDILEFNENLLADENHFWGSNSLHFEHSYFDDMTNQLIDIINWDLLLDNHKFSKIVKKLKFEKKLNFLLKYRLNGFILNKDNIDDLSDSINKIQNIISLENDYSDETIIFEDCGLISNFNNHWLAQLGKMERTHMGTLLYVDKMSECGWGHFYSNSLNSINYFLTPPFKVEFDIVPSNHNNSVRFQLYDGVTNLTWNFSGLFEVKEDVVHFKLIYDGVNLFWFKNDSFIFSEHHLSADNKWRVSFQLMSSKSTLIYKNFKIRLLSQI